MHTAFTIAKLSPLVLERHYAALLRRKMGGEVDSEPLSLRATPILSPNYMIFLLH